LYQQPLSFLLPESDWRPPRIEDLPTDWNIFSRVAFDTETHDEFLTTLGPGTRRGAYIVGFTLAFEDGPAFYLPIRHDGGGNMDARQVIEYIRWQGARYTGTLVGANLPYDLDMCEEIGITFPQVAWFRDVLIAEPLLDELQWSYSLENVAQRRLGVGKDETLLEEAAAAHLLKGAKGNAKSVLWRLHSRFVGPYGERDGTLPLHLLRVQEKELEAQNLNRVWDLESKVLPVVTRMRRRGLRVDEDRLEWVAQWAVREETAALAEVHRLTGVSIGFGHAMDAKKGAQMLRSIGVEPGYTRQGKDSVTAPLLDSIDHPAAASYRWARQMAKIRTTYADGVKRLMTNGRVHCTFNQLRATSEGGDSEKGVITGRISAVDPNLLNQPVRDPKIGPIWLSIYIPEDGRKWALPDFSQQEPRWLVEWSILAGPKRLAPKPGRNMSQSAADAIGRKTWEAAKEFARLYREDPTTDFHNMTSTICEPDYPTYDSARKKLVRGRYKAIGLGNIYGKGGPKLCRELGLPTEYRIISYGARKGQRIEVAGPEGQSIMDRFNNAVPFARAMLQADMEQAKSLGYVRTWSERRLHFERDLDGNTIENHKGLNKRIQGSSADQTKTAMIEVEKEGIFLQLQIYDSLGASVVDEREAKRMCEIMENCIPMQVPMCAELKMGDNWGELA